MTPICDRQGMIWLSSFLTITCIVSVSGLAGPPRAFDPFSNREFASAKNLSTGDVLVHLVNNVVVRLWREELVFRGEFDDDAQPAMTWHGYLVSGAFCDFAYGRGVSAVEVNARLDAILDEIISDIDVACNLTDLQRQKLKLAGAGDVKRFFQVASQAETRFQAYREIHEESAIKVWLNDMKSIYDRSMIRNGRQRSIWRWIAILKDASEATYCRTGVKVANVMACVAA